MNEKDIQHLISRVRDGSMARREFVWRMLQVGIGAPLAGQLLLHAGIGPAQSASSYRPTRRGGGGALKVLYWQGPTVLNPHLSNGLKDVDACRVFYDPLASWDAEGNLVPNLATEVPTRQNGGISADGKTITWRLKRGVQWHDGRPFTSADVVFNWEYASDPETASTTIGSYENMKVRAIDEFTVAIEYEKVRAYWADPFVGTGGLIIPKHIFAPYKGAKSQEAPANLKPVGTGPYKFVAFTPGDLVRGQINSNYHQPNRPYFDTIEIKGGGDAVSAARAVLQTGEYDYAWNLQVEDDILKRLEAGGKGRVESVQAGDIEFIELNFTDPWTEVEGERASIKTKHPVLSDPAVREALNLLVDRTSLQQVIYGRAGTATANFVNSPEQFRSKNNRFEFSVEKASQLLEKAGWKLGADGVRAKDGKKLKLVFQTSVNQPRQKAQAIIKQACQKAGIELELKAINGSVFFSSDVGNPDTNSKFYSDLQMYTLSGGPDPEPGLRRYCSWEVAAKENKWQRLNVGRWRNEEYDKIFRTSEIELDPVKRAAQLIRLNDLVIQDRAVLPLIWRSMVHAAGSKLRTVPAGWDSEFWALADWHRVP